MPYENMSWASRVACQITLTLNILCESCTSNLRLSRLGDAWSRLVQPGITRSTRWDVEGDTADQGRQVQDGYVRVSNSDGVQYAFAYQSCRNWQVCCPQ